MGDSRHLESISDYQYSTQHILNNPSRGTLAFGRTPEQKSSTTSCHSHSNYQQSPHTLLLLHPLLQLVQINNHQQRHYPVYLSPTVTVSPHSQSPATDRDQTRNAAKKQYTKSTQPRQKLDGNKVFTKYVHSGDSPMTSNAAATMGGRKEDSNVYPVGQRPAMISHHSSSVPSTPHQYPREFTSRSRSPSPNGGLGSHSPRSVSSEANGLLPSLRAGQPRQACRFETNVAFGRRRIPYTSADPLERATEEPKKALDPHEDDKLSGDMRELYDRILPTKESEERRSAFVKKLENILRSEWPMTDFKVHVFGSSGNLLYTSESDVDVCIQTPMRELEYMHMLAAALAKHGMEKVVCVPSAKVPIVKIWDPELQLASDMNVNNTLALENTRMIKTYVQIDERVRPLAMIIKYWTKQRILNDAAFGGTISSYTWICMILNFLQTRQPPILPALHELPYRKLIKETGDKSEFADDLDKLRGFGEKNKETLGQLLFHFFRRYGHEIDYNKDVISVRAGRLLSRKEKGWHLESLTKEARNRLCVEEPFNTIRNLGNSADDFAWRGIHLEIRQAFDLLADGGQLEKACQQYEFPQEEKIVFKKPTPTVKPILTHSPSQLGRGGRGGNHRGGGRGNFNAKGSHVYGRRASSGASFGNNRPPFLQSPPITSGQENYFGRGGINEQLHDQLYHQYQLLEAQQLSLKAQLVAQNRAHQAQHFHAAQMQAHAHAIAQAQAHAQAQAQAHTQAQSRGQSTNGSPQKSPFVNGRSSPHLTDMAPSTAPLPQGFLYPYPAFYDQSQAMTSSSSQDGSRTNPSSPSLTHSIPGLRRATHRSSAASDTASIRSQSQPARGVTPGTILQGYPPMPFVDPQTFAGYPIARSTQEIPSSQTSTEPPFSPLSLSAYPETAVPSDHGTRKEYLGYYVDPSQMRAQFREPMQPPVQEQLQPQFQETERPPLQDYKVGQIPSFNELAQRRRRVSSEITQPLLSTALRRVSRSPSPLGGHIRSYSTGVTPPSGAKNPPRKDRIDSTHPPPEDGGLVIANGSYPTKPRESRAMSESVDSLSSNTVGTDGSSQSALGIYVPGSELYKMTTPERRLYADELLQRHNAAELGRAGTTNGISDRSPSDMNDLSRIPSGSEQPFPQLPESLLNYGPVNAESVDRAAEVSPTRSQGHQWRGNAYQNGLSAIDTLNAPRAPPQEIKSAGLPLLSPVFETRTPSPTVSRQGDISKQLANGTNQASKDSSQKLPSRPKNNGTAPQAAPKENQRSNQQKKDASTSEKTTKGNPGGGTPPGNWQQSGAKRRNKKSKGSNQNKPNEAKTQGEPLPANEADRKGG